MCMQFIGMIHCYKLVKTLIQPTYRQPNLPTEPNRTDSIKIRQLKNGIKCNNLKMESNALYMKLSIKPMSFCNMLSNVLCLYGLSIYTLNIS